MSPFTAFILGIVQGLTEFIPVSSSGHLILVHAFLGKPANALAFDVALHIGTLAALVLFFYRDIWVLGKALLIKSKDTKQARLLAVASIPAVISGILLGDLAETAFRSVPLVCTTLILVGALLILSDRFSNKKAEKITTIHALTMGFAQALAIVPGVSRSGSTIIAGRFVGLNREQAARFSFLLAIPITAGAALKVLFIDSGYELVDSEPLIFTIGILSALVSGLVAIRFLLRFVAKHRLGIFGWYRIALGVLILTGYAVL